LAGDRRLALFQSAEFRIIGLAWVKVKFFFGLASVQPRQKKFYAALRMGVCEWEF
jgi:hypothetical protein